MYEILNEQIFWKLQFAKTEAKKKSKQRTFKDWIINQNPSHKDITRSKWLYQ